MPISPRTLNQNNFVNSVLQRIGATDYQIVKGLVPTSLFFDIVDDHTKVAFGKSTSKTSVSIVNGDKNKIYITDSSGTRHITQEELHKLIDQSTDKLFINKKATPITPQATDVVLNDLSKKTLIARNIYLDTETNWQLYKPPSMVSPTGDTLEALLTYHMNEQELKVHKTRKTNDINYRRMMETVVDPETYSEFANTPYQVALNQSNLGETKTNTDVYLYDGNSVQEIKKQDYVKSRVVLNNERKKGIVPLTDDQQTAYDTNKNKFIDLAIEENNQTTRQRTIESLYDDFTMNASDPNQLEPEQVVKKTITDLTKKQKTVMAQHISQLIPEQRRGEFPINIIGANIEFDTKALENSFDMDLQQRKVDLLESARATKQIFEPTVISSETKQNMFEYIEDSINSNIEIIKDSLGNKDDFFQSEVATRYNSRKNNNFLNRNKPITTSEYETGYRKSLQETQDFLNGSFNSPELQEITQQVETDWMNKVKNLQDIIGENKQKNIGDMIERTFDVATRERTGNLTEFTNIAFNAVADFYENGPNDAQSNDIIKKYQTRLSTVAHNAANDNESSRLLRDLLLDMKEKDINIKQSHVTKGVLSAELAENVPEGLQFKVNEASRKKPLNLVRKEQDISNIESTVGSLSRFIAGSTAVAIGSMVSNYAKEDKDEDNREDIYELIRRNAQSKNKTTSQKLNPLWATGLGLGSIALLHSVNNMSQTEFNMKTSNLANVFSGIMDYAEGFKVRTKSENISMIKGGIKNIASDISESMQKTQNKFISSVFKGAKSYVDNFDDSKSMSMIGIGVVAAAAVVGLSSAGRNSGKIKYEESEREKQNDYYKVLTNQDQPEQQTTNSTNYNIDDSLLFQENNQNDLEITNKVPITNMKNFSDNFNKSNNHERETEKQIRDQEVEDNQQQFYDGMKKTKDSFSRIQNDLNKSHMKGSTRVR